MPDNNIIHIQTQAPIRSILYLTPHVTVHATTPPPNAWWRLWQWLLLGWKWKRGPG